MAVKAEVRSKSAPRARGTVSRAPLPKDMRSVPTLAALEAIREDYARGLVLVQVAPPRRPRKRARNEIIETLRLLVHQVTCATSLADAQVHAIVGDDGVVTMRFIAT